MSKTKAQLEKENKKLKKDLSDSINSLQWDLDINFQNVSDSNFTMKTEIIWDKATVKVMGDVAKGLLNMTELFKNQKIELPAMLSVNGVDGMKISGVSLMADCPVNAGFNARMNFFKSEEDLND